MSEKLRTYTKDQNDEIKALGNAIGREQERIGNEIVSGRATPEERRESQLYIRGMTDRIRVLHGIEPSS